jgi:hypothetical protein
MLEFEQAVWDETDNYSEKYSEGPAIPERSSTGLLKFYYQ